MKSTVLGLVLGSFVTGLALFGLGHKSEALAQRTPAFDANAELITVTASVGDNRQQLTVIDPRTRVMSVYHLELATGAITLKSVRKIQWDLQMDEFNGVNPLPRDVKSLLESR